VVRDALHAAAHGAGETAQLCTIDTEFTFHLRLLIRWRTVGTAFAQLLRLVTIQVILIAGNPTAAQVSVSTAIDVDISDPRWVSDLVEAVTFQAKEGARQLSTYLLEARRPPTDFVPLAAFVTETAR